jgi:hypothetical protein
MQVIEDSDFPSGMSSDEAGEGSSAPFIERKAFASGYESLTFTMVSRAARELTVTLAVQPLFDLAQSAVVGRRIRRTVRHLGGEAALFALGRRSLETTDLKRIDLQTLKHGLDLLGPTAGDCGVLPAYWRTVASSGGRFALLCAELQHVDAPKGLLVEIVGGLENAPPEAVQAAISHFGLAALGVVAHIAPDAASARRLAPAQLQCLSIDFAGVALDGARDWEEAARLIVAARQAAPQVLLLNLRPDRGLAARAAGATHAVFAGMEPITI